MVENLKTELIKSQGNSNYNTDIDSLNASINRLYKTISEINTRKSFHQKNANYSINDFKTQLTDFQDKLKKIYGSIECGLKTLGLGYGKGVTADISLGGTIPPLVIGCLEGHGGGGIEIVYDFPTMQRTVIPSTICGASGTIGVGLASGVAALNLSGYYDWISGFNSSNTIKQDVEGPSQSISLNLSTDILDLFGIPVGIGIEMGSYVKLGDICDYNSLVQCPNLNGYLNPVEGITIGFDASIGAGSFFVVAIGGSLIGTCSFYLPGTTRDFLDNSIRNENLRRFYAAWNMSAEILLGTPSVGIMNPFVINDVTASCAALTYGSFNPNNCNSNPCPQLLTPVNGYITSSLTPTLTCQPYIGASNYNFQVSTESNFNNPILNANSRSCQYQIENGILVIGTQYFWKVKTTNLNGNTSPWSDVWSFTTYSNNMLGTPILLNPSNNSTNILPTEMLDWDDVANAMYYELQIDQNGDFSSPIVDQSTIPISQYSNPAGVLQLNTKYYWRVKAKNSTNSSLWSEIWSFTTINGTPSNVILPLAVGNYWTYLPDITSQTVTISITGTVIIQGETCYKWFAQGDQYEWFYKNKGDGCWAYGYNGPYQYPPDLEYKYPANPTDTWITNWIAVPVPTTLTCESTNITFESYSGCYKYHFFLPMKKDNYYTNMFKSEVLMKLSGLKTTATDGYDVYQYFVPGIGMVGWENYFQGTRLYKVVLTNYHLNK